MTSYKVRFIKWAMAIDVFVRMEDEERAAYEENSTGSFVTMQEALVERAAQTIEVMMFGDLGLISGGPLFIPDNWDWQVTEL